MRKLTYSAPEVKVVTFEADGMIMLDISDGTGFGDGDILENEAAPSASDSSDPKFEDVDWGI